MTVRSLICAFAVLVIASGRPARADDGDRCADILKRGVFDRASYEHDASLRQYLDHWFCKTDWRTHEEARDEGIGLTVPVYGVPVTASGTFDAKTRDEWKRTHCGEDTATTDYHEYLAAAYARASPLIVEAWSSCMERAGRLQVACGIEQDHALDSPRFSFFARYQRRHSDDPGPRITFFKVFGGTCTSPPAVDTRLGTLALDCTRSQIDLPVTVSLEVDGQPGCVRSLPSRYDVSCPRYFEGTTTFTADTTVACDKVVFAPNAKVRALDGASLTIFARNIVFERDGLVESIGRKGDPGAPGRSARNGCDVWCPGHQDWSDARDRCRGGDPDRDGDNGYNGGTGGTGYPGGKVTLYGRISGTYSCVQRGGPGGDGGTGGCGKKLRCCEHGGEYYECNGQRGNQGGPGADKPCAYGLLPEPPLPPAQTKPVQAGPARPIPGRVAPPAGGCHGCGAGGPGSALATAAVCFLFVARRRRRGRVPDRR